MKTKIRAGIFLAVTLLILFSAAYLDSIPNHRFGYGDWDIWLAATVFPLMFFLHGVISGVALERFRSLLYFTVTPVLLFVLFAIRPLFDSSLDFWADLWRAVLGGVLCFAFSFAGFSLAHMIKKAVLALVQYEKDRKERKSL